MAVRNHLRLYLDETGQDTKGLFFLVVAVVTGGNRESLREELERIETLTRKRRQKWRKASFDHRIRYLEAVVDQRSFANSLVFCRHEGSTSYTGLTAETAAVVIKQRSNETDRATVVVDGLTKPEVSRFKFELRRHNLGVRNIEVKGARDESEPLIRLADAAAGFLRDYSEGKSYTASLYRRAVERQLFAELR